MASTTVSDLKAHLSAWLDRVQAGEEVLVTDRGRPVVRLVSAADLPDDDVARLVRQGLLRPAAGTLPEGFWERSLAAVTAGAGVRAVIRDRDEGR